MSGLVAGSIAGCSGEPPASAAPYSTALPTVADADAAARGSIVSSTTSTDFDPDAFPAGTVAATFVYNSISGVTGESTEVTGALFEPSGPAPADGRPVVAYAHGSVGISPGCAPTETSELSGDAEAVSYLLGLGYAVAYTDYQGLGSGVEAPPHPYLEPKTAAFNVIDSVRAARNLDPSLSERWVAVGSSQGGHAAWAANEFDSAYGDGLDLLGAAVLAPALDVSPVVALAQSSSLSSGQRSLYPLIVEGAAAVDPSIEPSDHLHGFLGENSADLVSCGPEGIAARTHAADNFALGDTTASSDEAEKQLTARLQEYSLPRAASSAPILAMYGSNDDIVLPIWTENALDRACEYGDTVLEVHIAGQGHSLDPGNLLGNWISDRFTGTPAPTNC